MAYELTLHDLGEGLTEAEVIAWLVAVGEPVKAGDALVEVETAKTTAEITAPRDGVLLHQGAAPGATLEVGRLLAVIGDPGESWSPQGMAAAAASVTTLPAAAQVTAPVKAMPVVRKVAADLGVDLAAVEGTGPGGAITRADVERAAAALAGTPLAPEPPGEAMSATRRAIAAHLTRSWTEIPHVTVWGPANAARLLGARADAGAGPLEAWLAAALLPVLADFPDCNATFDGTNLHRSKEVHLGLAVDTAAGLMVPVVKDAHARSHDDLAAEIERLVAAAADRTLTPADVTGATVTLSNVGAVGGGYGTPIIPHGTTTIVSVGRAKDDVVVVGGQAAVAPVFPVAVSFDHRVIDGATGSRFLNAVIDRIERFGG
jgi:2-oxoisovalerate dehydrogenase E2 component (dihydrolipoyl transacylase)